MSLPRRITIIKNLLLFIGIAFVIVGAYVWQGDTILSALTSGGESDSGLPENVESAGPPAPKVIVENVRLTSNARVFEAVGTGRARLSVRVYAAVSDEVEEVLFTAGQHVKKGDVLVQLKDDEEELAVRLAEVNLKDAESLLQRYERAGQEGAVPESEVDSARADFEGAKVALDQAKLDLEDRKVRAPFDGVVGLPNVDPGDRVSPDMAVTNLDDRSVLLVDYEIPEQLLSSLVANDAKAVEFTTPAYPGRVFEGEVESTESRLNAARRTLLIRARIDNADDMLRPGMSFGIRWRIPGGDYPTVPEISLQWGREGSFVWVVRDGKAERVFGRVVARSAGSVLLDGELRDGDQIVIEGLQRLRDQTEVEILGDPAVELLAQEDGA